MRERGTVFRRKANKHGSIQQGDSKDNVSNYDNSSNNNSNNNSNSNSNSNSNNNSDKNSNNNSNSINNNTLPYATSGTPSPPIPQGQARGRDRQLPCWTLHART
jgi:hypothetical protein